jgi:alkylation response protein AidB-like acyl-CoA dehydrogenase
MNLDFSDDQKHLKSEARRFLEAKCPPSRVRDVIEGRADGYDRDLWRAVADQGWLGAAIPEEYNGLGLGRLELCVVAEELGRALAPIPFASTLYFFAEAILLAGDADQRSAFLPRLAAGELIGALAAAEGPGPASPASIRAVVNGLRLSGTKLPVTDGDIADHALVLAQENGRPGLFLADLSGPGVARETVQTLDPTRSVAKLVFDGAPVTRLGPAGQGAELLAQVMDRAAVLIAFEQIGGADRCLEIARDYALERYAFSRPIGSYQAIKHRLADMFIKNELARSNAYYGAWALSTDAPELPLAASAARISATEAFNFAAREAIQVHGGVGFTWAMDCHLFYRRSRQLGLVAGPPRAWKERLVGQLEARNAA